MEVLLRISQDMAWVLDKLTAPKASIDMEQGNSIEQAWMSLINPNTGWKSYKEY